MLSFEKKRVVRDLINSTNFKFPIPVVSVTPKQTTDESCVFIFSPGMDFTNSSCLYLNNKFYDNHWFIAYERMNHGENKNKPSQFKKPYLKEIIDVINWAKQKLPGRKIYLMGESWGGAIVLYAIEKYPNIVNGVIAWNVPTKPKDSEKNTPKVIFECACKEIFTLLTNVTCYLPVVQKTHDKISQNAIFVRAMSLRPVVKQNSKTIIAVWRYMFSSKHFLLKNGRSNKYNYLYIQSGQDALCDPKNVKKIITKSDELHCNYIPTGYHLLSLEPTESNVLYEKITNFIKRK